MRALLRLLAIVALLACGVAYGAGTLLTLGAGPGSSGAACADTSWGSVVWLIGNDSAANGSTTFTDQSSKLHTQTTAGTGPSYSNGAAPSGLTTSLSFPGGGRMQTANSADFNFGAGDFTIEYFQFVTSAQSSNPVNNVPNISSVGEVNSYMSTSSPQATGFGVSTDGSSWNIITNIGTNYALSTWQHVAAYRSGNNVYASIGGTVSSLGTVSGSLFNSASAFFVGALGDNNLSLTGNLASVRVTKGVARYGAGNFTPPTLPMPAC